VFLRVPACTAAGQHVPLAGAATLAVPTRWDAPNRFEDSTWPPADARTMSSISHRQPKVNLQATSSWGKRLLGAWGSGAGVLVHLRWGPLCHVAGREPRRVPDLNQGEPLAPKTGSGELKTIRRLHTLGAASFRRNPETLSY
jgi:hypothetical protein